MLPAILVVIGHARFRERFHLLELAGELRLLQRKDAHQLVAAGIVHLVELVAGAEFGADGVPQKLHDLDAVLVADVVGAADIFGQIFVDVGIFEIARVRRQIDQAGGDHLFDDVADRRIGFRHEQPVGRGGAPVRQHRAVDPGLGVVGHGIGQRPEQIAPADDFADLRLHAAKAVDAGGARRLDQNADQKIELHRQPHAALHGEAVEEAGFRIEILQPLDVAVDEHVLPGDERVVEHEDGVVLVEARGQRIIPRRAGRGGGEFVGLPADQLDAGRVHRRDEHHHHARIVDLLAHVLAEEIVVGQRRIGGDHFGAGDVDPGVGFLLNGDVDVFDLFDRLVAVDRRIDQRVVEIEHRLLRALVPGARVVGELAVKLGVGAERVEEGGLVVGAAAEPAVGDARPGGDGVALRDDVFARIAPP